MRFYIKLTTILISIIPLLYQIVLGLDIISYLMYVPYILVIMLFLLFSKRFNISKNVLLVSLVLIITYLFLPFLFFTIGNYEFIKSLTYIVLYLIFIISLTLLTQCINLQKVLNGMFISNSLGLIYFIGVNLHEINNLTIISFFTGDRINRASYGLGHPNTAAMFIFIEILLIYILFIKGSNKKKIGVFLCIGLMIPLISTGSRTAILSLFMFFILEIYLYINSILVNKKIKYLFLLMIFFTVILIFVYKFDISNLIVNSSGRNIAINNNIKYLIENKLIFTGIGPIPISELVTKVPMLTITDTWYITHMICYGLLGLILIMLVIVYIFINLIRNSSFKNSHTLSLLIVLLFYSCAENVLFVPGTILSVISWILFYKQLDINCKTRINIRK